MTALQVCNGQIFFSIKNQLVVKTENNLNIVNLPENPTIGKTNVEGNINQDIVCSSVSRDDKFIAVSTENKRVVIFDNYFNVVKNFSVPRVSSQICFTPTNSLIVADRTGDVYLYSLESDNVAPVLILGHMSVVLDVTVTESGDHIISCDRDEKIRVSSFPNAYNIESFCLGHDEFVISIKVVGKNLISASGDGTVRFWNYLSGKQLKSVNTNDYINESLIEKFCEEMISNDVEVTALPITDMQAYFSNNDIFVAVSLFSVKELLLFSINSDTLMVNFCKHIQVGKSFSFNLSAQLLILTCTEIQYFELGNCNYNESMVKKIDCANISDVCFKSNQNISLLYKKRFDNVSEYIERKKARMELN